MSDPFDPGGFYEFDMAQGAVRTRNGARVLVLSDAAVTPLVAAAVANGDLTAVRRLGREIGQHISGALGGKAEGMTPEAVVGHAAGVVALFGWGKLGFERWGDASVAVMDSAPALDEDQLAVAALLGGMFSSLAGRDVACVPAGDRRFILVDPSVAEQIWMWSKEGADLPAILGRLAPSGGGASQ